jgi:hypothetical protein
MEVLEDRMVPAFLDPVAYTAEAGPASVAVGDFRGNGVLDLAVANTRDNTVSVLMGNGDGSFQDAVNYTVGSGPASVAVGDFLGNGRLDLAVADRFDNTVSVLLCLISC